MESFTVLVRNVVACTLNPLATVNSSPKDGGRPVRWRSGNGQGVSCRARTSFHILISYAWCVADVQRSFFEREGHRTKNVVRDDLKAATGNLFS